MAFPDRRIGRLKQSVMQQNWQSNSIQRENKNQIHSTKYINQFKTRKITGCHSQKH